MKTNSGTPQLKTTPDAGSRFMGTAPIGPAGQLGIILGLTAITAVCFLVIKAGLPYAPPLRFAGLRALIAGVALLGLMIILHRPLLPPRARWPAISALGLVSTTLAFGAMFLSPSQIGSGIASVLGNTQPVMVPVLAAHFLGERRTRRQWMTLALGLLGVGLIALPTLARPGYAGVVGPLLALTAAGGLSVGTILVKRLGAQLDILALTAWQLIIGSLPLLAVSAIVERSTPIRWTSTFIGLLLFLALGGTAFATAVWYWLIRANDVGRLALFLFLVPIGGLVLGSMVFAEPISVREGAGAAVILIGMGVIAQEARASQSHGRPGLYHDDLP